MALDTYANLQLAVASWMARTDLTATIPDLITLFEQDLLAEDTGFPLRVRQMEGRVPLSATGQYTTLPAGFLEMRSLRITSNAAQDPGDPLQVASPDWIQAHYPIAASVGRPKFYAIVGPEIMLGPAPNMTYALEADIYTFTPLSTGAPTNWLLTAYPQLYLFGTLAQAAPFIRADLRMATWEKKRDRAVNGLKNADVFARWPRGTMQSRPQGSTP